MKTNALYIHIPFCKSICTYCDFKRILNNDQNFINEWINNLIININKKCKWKKYRTIYIGGGTPNVLNNNQLNKLLSCLKKYLKNDYEFTIECNPELVNEHQVKIFANNKINRISLGVQSLNQNILKLMNRKHTVNDVLNAINLFKKFNINNISLDFIYNYPTQTLTDIKQTIIFAKNNNINHISYYALEIKDNAFLKNTLKNIDVNSEEKQLLYLCYMMKKYGYKRYEISNWSTSNKYQSWHNMTYWKYNYWIAIGYGAYGYEKNCSYYYPSIKNFNISKTKLSKSEQEKNKLIMNLRLFCGFDLKIKNNMKIFIKYKNKLHNYYIDKNMILRPTKYDCLNDTIYDL